MYCLMHYDFYLSRENITIVIMSVSGEKFRESVNLFIVDYILPKFIEGSSITTEVKEKIRLFPVFSSNNLGFRISQIS